jgi:hypothetical protein
MVKYPKRIKTIKRINKIKRIKTTIDELEPGSFVVTTTEKPRKRKS